MDSEAFPLFPADAAWEAVQAELEARELGDGLPLVPPTLDRLGAMLAGHGPSDRSFGFMMPLMGELSLYAVAYNCVLAGCRPEELPLVLTAAEACLEPEFNLLGVLSTTGTPAVAVLVHGPVVEALGINAGGNCLGPGNRANACIGRALSLVLRNVGGARPGVGDMATMGSPGKYTFCFAEAPHPVFPSLAARRGISSGESAVTVLGVSGTQEVLPEGDGDTPERVLRPTARAMRTAIELTRSAERPGRGEQVILLPPELADLIARHGWDLPRVQAFLFDEGVENRPAARSAEDIHPIVTGGAGLKMSYLPLWSGGSDTVTKPVPTLA